MKQKYKIKRVNINHEGVFTGFILEGVFGDVDPFVGAEFVDEPEFKSQQEIVDWAQDQIGKTLFCDELVTKCIATYGKTYIV